MVDGDLLVGHGTKLVVCDKHFKWNKIGQKSKVCKLHQMQWGLVLLCETIMYSVTYLHCVTELCYKTYFLPMSLH